jgi:DNA segregation ATPase FtsK/SpoIIIE, S-DNA-T family
VIEDILFLCFESLSSDMLGLENMNDQAENFTPPDDLAGIAQRIEQVLSEFGIQVTMGAISSGPTTTRFELHPAPGVRLEEIFALSNNIAAALRTDCNVFGPVPGKGCLGIDVENATKTKVLLRDLWTSVEWHHVEGRLPLILGKDVYNRVIFADLAEMPHLLIGGTTGSGKSVFIDGIIASLLQRFSQDQLRFVMIDANVIELQHYSGLPHLIGPVVTDLANAPLALQWVVNEISRRYEKLAGAGARNIVSFNREPYNNVSSRKGLMPFEQIVATPRGFSVETKPNASSQHEEKTIPRTLPHIVLILNEPAELMLSAPEEVELAIARITQMGRAVGVHLVMATRDLSVATITSKVKANIPARIAFQVSSRADSRTILDAHGAEKLLGKGDMLYLAPGSHKLQRLQAPFITEQEITEIVASFRAKNTPDANIQNQGHDHHQY